MSRNIIIAAIAALAVSMPARAQDAAAVPQPAPAPVVQTAPAQMAPAPTAASPAIAAQPQTPPRPLTIEERVAQLEKDVQTIAQAVNTIAGNAASAQYVQGLARDVVSVQQQVTDITRALTIPAPKAVKAPAKAPAVAAPKAPAKK